MKVHGSCDLGEGWPTKAMSDEGVGGDDAGHKYGGDGGEDGHHNYGEADGKHRLNQK